MRIALLSLCIALTGVACAQSPEPNDCTADVHTTPSRPTVSSPAETTQCGVVEAEYGFNDSFGSGNSLGGALRYGITPRIEFRWDNTQLTSAKTDGITRYGTGDNLLLAKYFFKKQTEHVPAMAVAYQIKFPTASASKNLGTGYTDHFVTVLFSKDVGPYRFDSNVFFNMNGSPTGYHYNNLFTFSGARSVFTKRFQLTAEGWGQTSYTDNPGFASFLFGATYATSDQTIFDIALDNGVTHFAPSHRLIFGVTHAFGRFSRSH